jgi:hypothetical protein
MGSGGLGDGEETVDVLDVGIERRDEAEGALARPVRRQG